MRYFAWWRTVAVALRSLQHAEQGARTVLESRVTELEVEHAGHMETARIQMKQQLDEHVEATAEANVSQAAEREAEREKAEQERITALEAARATAEADMNDAVAVAEIESARQLEDVEARHTAVLAQHSEMATMQVEELKEVAAAKAAAEMLCTEVCVICECRGHLSQGHMALVGVDPCSVGGEADVYDVEQHVFTVGYGSARDRGTAFAKAVFMDMDRDGDGSLTKSEIRKYFKSHSIEKAHILGPNFTWKAFFEGMDTDGNGQFDLDEFTEMIVKLYHDQEGDVVAEKQSEANAAGGFHCGKCWAEAVGAAAKRDHVAALAHARAEAEAEHDRIRHEHTEDKEAASIRLATEWAARAEQERAMALETAGATAEADGMKPLQWQRSNQHGS